jgi:hypothetical protein
MHHALVATPKPPTIRALLEPTLIQKASNGPPRLFARRCQRWLFTGSSFRRFCQPVNLAAEAISRNIPRERALRVAGNSLANTEETPMKKICLAAVSGAALLGLASFASAQKSETGTLPDTGSAASGPAANQCWDVSTNMVRDKSAAATGGASGSTADSTRTTGAAGSGAAGSAGSASGSPPATAAAARPAGMPNC